jgi:hypothetical protein
MPQRKKDAMEIREVLRRVRVGESDRAIARAKPCAAIESGLRSKVCWKGNYRLYRSCKGV